MTDSGFIIRNARLDEVAEMAQVDRLSWPEKLATTEDQFVARLAAFPEGQWVAEQSGRIVAVSSAQRIPESLISDSHCDHNSITDQGRFTNTHVTDGDVYQLIGVGVLPEYRWLQLGRRMIDHQLAFARSLTGVHRIVGFTRPVRYHRYSDVPIDEYVRRRTPAGRSLDPVLSFHLDSGAKLVSVHPGFRPEDTKSCGYAVLIEYPVD